MSRENKSNYLTPAEFAEKYFFHPETVRQWLRTGKLKGIKPVGARAWRIHKDAVYQ